MSGRLAGETVLVTGAARGIGAAIAEVAAREGAGVALLDLTDPAESSHELARRYDVPTAGVRVDVSDEPALVAAIEQAAGTLGPVSVLVNNAGRNARFDPLTLSTEDWDAAFAVLLKAAWLAARAVLPGMIAAGRGSIVNIASIHARMTAEGFFPYGAAKAGLVGMTRNLALDVARHGIRVNAVSPGYIGSPPVQQMFDDDPAERDRVLGVHPLGRIGTSLEIAEVVCFLASPAASYVTGAEWAVDGGLGVRFA
jgi:NAD(P)-dependent dehydrogenase (short-subunit alcohol dehydrogenase family)